MILLILFLLIQTICGRIGVQVCKTNGDCNPDSYCNDGRCQKCIDCHLLFRKGNSCITDLSECGSCLEGYEENLLTDLSTVVKPCKPIETAAKSERCLNGNPCPPNKYCFQNSCVTCFDCELYNRLPSFEGCARQPNECGPCINGFYELPVTTEQNAKPCEMIASFPSEMSDSPKYLKSSSINTLLVGLFLGLALVVFAILMAKQSKKGEEITIATESPIPSAPPLYTLDMPPNYKKLEEEIPTSAFVNEGRQQAIVFQLPQASYYRATEEEGGGEEELSADSLEREEADGNPSSHSSHSSGVRPEAEERVCSFRGIFNHRYVEFRSFDSAPNFSSQQQPSEIELFELKNESTDESDAVASSNTCEVVKEETSQTLSQVDSSSSVDLKGIEKS